MTVRSKEKTGSPDKLSHSDASRIAGQLFGKVLRRDSDSGGYAYVLDCLESGTKSVAELMIEMIASDEFVDRFTDLAASKKIANRVHVLLLGRSIDDSDALGKAARRLMRIGLPKYAEEIARAATLATLTAGVISSNDTSRNKAGGPTAPQNSSPVHIPANLGIGSREKQVETHPDIFSEPSIPIDDIAPKQDASSLYCQWIWHALTVLCDGTVTCGLDDPFKTRNYGSVKSESLQAIFDKPAVQRRRSDLKAGTPCKGCSMYTSADRIRGKDLAPSDHYPRILILEPSIKCNIRCRNETCDIANDATVHLRREDFMPWRLFCKLMDEAAPHIADLYFYNYGEPFVHPKALDMLAYAKKANPKLRVTTSTNGILLARDGVAERIVQEELIDWICFTIGGVDQDTYVRYHKSGSFEKAILGMRRLIEQKRKVGKTTATVHWRYLIFHWNDSDAHIAEALRLREEIGVDEFKFMLTSSPLAGRSLRRAPGTPGFDAIKPWLAYQDDYRPDLFSESGFWGEERNGGFGAYRWTGKQAKFRVQPTDNRVNIRLARTDVPMVPLPDVRLRLPWGEFAADIGVGGHWAVNAIPVPEGYRHQNIDVELEVDAVFAPIRNGDSADNRELGVMVSMTGVSPASNPFRVSIVEQDRAQDLSR